MAKIRCGNCGARFRGNFCPICATPAPKQPQGRKNGGILPVVIMAALIVLISCFAGGKPAERLSGGERGGTVSAGEASSPPDSAPVISISEQELYDQNGILVTAKKMRDGMLGPEISVAIENNSDRNVMISARSLSVNGFMMTTSGMFSVVAAGKGANSEITLMTSELQKSGISTIGEITFYLNIADADTFKTIDATELITVETSAAGTFLQGEDDSGDQIFGADDLRIVCKGLKKDSVWDGSVVFYLENNSGKNVSIYAEDVSVNGDMADVGMFSDLRPGTKMIDGMNLLNTGLDSIEDIRNVEFNLHIVDSDTLQSVADSGVIRLEFNQ